MIKDIRVMSTLSKTWLFDLDGTIVKHNGYKIDSTDTLLPGAKAYLDALPEEDVIIILTSRTEAYRTATIDFLKRNQIRFDHIIFNLPYGERVVVNDKKPSGLDMAAAFNLERDHFYLPEINREL